MNDLAPFLVPIFALLIPIVAIIGGNWSQVQSNRIKAEQRLAMIARGIPLNDIEAFFKSDSSPSARRRDPLRSLANTRRTAVILISVGLGMIVFGFLLAAILGIRQVLATSAAGLIPLFIGFGFVIDYFLQKRDLSRLALEMVDTTSLHD